MDPTGIITTFAKRDSEEALFPFQELHRENLCRLDRDTCFLQKLRLSLRPSQLVRAYPDCIEANDL
ncbi:unnamed protein product [Prunus brigantina]